MKKLIWMAVLIACFVVPLGAYVRLSDAGLGCPDWPGCYGEISPSHAKEEILQAEQQNPAFVSMGKAWKEMIHRYLASFLGLLIVSITAIAWYKKTANRQFCTALLLLVIFQGLLGMWTVTLLLKPAIVTLHLIGGILTTSLLAWLALNEHLPIIYTNLRYRIWTYILCLLTLGQIYLGGWVSTNYAALACQDFPPFCQGSIIPEQLSFHGFHLFRELGETANGDLLSLWDLITIHWMHRIGALILSLAIVTTVIRFWKVPTLNRHIQVLLGLWFLQILIGLGNIIFQIPLSLAVAHNFVALLLFVCVFLLANRMKS